LWNVLNAPHAQDSSQTGMLDNLYSQILDEAFSITKLSYKEQKESLGVIHTAVMTGIPVTCEIIAELLGYNLGNVKATISELQSVVYINASDQAIYIFHASFGDYLMSGERSKKMSCNELEHHALLASHCLSLMESQLRFNICNLPSSFLRDDEVPDIQMKIKQNLGESLQYSCLFWGHHLSRGKLAFEIAEQMERFMKRKILFWIEAMSIMGRLSECVRALDLVFRVS
jgi:hypothetical protein